MGSVNPLTPVRKTTTYPGLVLHRCACRGLFSSSTSVIAQSSWELLMSRNLFWQSFLSQIQIWFGINILPVFPCDIAEGFLSLLSLSTLTWVPGEGMPVLSVRDPSCEAVGGSHEDTASISSSRLGITYTWGCEERPGGVFLSSMSHRLILDAEAPCAFLTEMPPHTCKPCVSRLAYCSVPAEVCAWR